MIAQLGENSNPEDGEPIELPNTMDLIVSPHRRGEIMSKLDPNAKYVMGADSDPQRVESRRDNFSVPMQFVLHSSHRLHRLVLQYIEADAEKAKDHYWIGDIRRSFEWMEIWGFGLESEASLGLDAFLSDTMMAWKVGYFNVAQVKNPWRMAHAYKQA